MARKSTRAATCSIQTPDGHLRNRIVIAGARLYQVMIRGQKDVVTSASADKFLASFEVTK